MYLARRSPLPTSDAAAPPPPGGRWRQLLVEPNVALLGATSFVTDVSSEMVASVLPLYLTVRLGFTALQFGATDGILGVAMAVTALVGALLADRWRRYREVAGGGYAVSAGTRLGLLSTRSWLPTLGWLGADRLGKGIRTGPRDALISLSAPPERLGEAFGLHRMLDTGGALAGPLLAVLLLSVAPGSYASVFVASFFIACLGLGVLWLFVENRLPAALADTKARLWTPVTTLWRHRRFRRVLLATALLSLPAVSDSFLFLTLRHRVGLDQRLFPILFTGESIVYLALAVPCGRLADRIGAGRVLLAGQVALAASYLLLVTAPGRTVSLIGVPAALGIFFAATDGVLATLASQVVPAFARTTGLAVLGVVLAAGRAVAATGYGAVWQRSGPHTAVTNAFIGLVVAGAVATIVLRPFLQGGGSAPPSSGEPSEFEVAPAIRPTRDGRVGRRVTAFVALAAVCISGVVVTAVAAAHRSRAASRASGAHLATTDRKRAASTGSGGAPSTALNAIVTQPHLLVLDTGEGKSFERLEAVDASHPQGARVATPLVCERVDQRGGRGLCLTNNRVAAVHGISIFDDSFRVLSRLPMDGLPSRARVAPNGRVGAATSFVQGDAYNVDNFSTRTLLIDLVAGRVIANLEDFAITKGGRSLHPIDENFWGVAFAADSDTFYATMRTGSHYYLVRGRVSSRRAEVLRDGVECPSLSPDGARIAYKSRIEHGFDPATWQLRVWTIASGADRKVAEQRSVDDQVAWLDDGHIIYGVAQSGPDNSTVDTWSVPSDGTGSPALLVPTGESPVVVPVP